jgi:hypothetical protein
VAIRRPIVVAPSGVLEVLPAGDTLPGGGASSAILAVATVTFTGGPQRFDVTVAGVTTTMAVFVSVVADSDELEMDPISASASCLINGVVTIYAGAATTVYGARKFNIRAE